MLLAVAFFVAADVPATTAAAPTAARQRATLMRLFIWEPPESGGPVARSSPLGGSSAKESAPRFG
jgi:hypothetical protein